MPQAKSDFTRRALFAAAGAGATLAVAAVARPFFRFKPERRFETEFRSPFARLASADHNIWSRQVGQTFQTNQGHVLQVAGVEAFAPFRAAGTKSSRGRAFMVSFDVLSGGTVAGDAIHQVNHPDQGPLDLFLIAPTDRPGRVQAIFS